MAITYKFHCPKCQYEDDIYVGNTKKEYIKGVPQHILGSCLDCSRLFSNTEMSCKYCNEVESSSPNINTFNRIKNWFLNKRPLPIHVKFYNEDYIKEVPCPKCSNKYLTTYPMLFSD